jgi:hypothetical protein
MPKKVIIHLHLVNESSKKANDELLKEISEAFSKEEVLIPWCNKVEKITLDEI